MAIYGIILAIVLSQKMTTVSTESSESGENFAKYLFAGESGTVGVLFCYSIYFEKSKNVCSSDTVRGKFNGPKI